MITVRFPNGQAVTYNEGWHIEYRDKYRAIYDKEGGDLKALVPYDCIIEWDAPCRVENPIAGVTLRAALELVRDSARSATDLVDLYLLAEVKAMLEKFNRQRRTWRK